MNMRNLLKTGNYVFLTPIGIRTTLQYNVSGNLEKVYVGYNDPKEDITDKVLSILLENHTVPTSIHVKSGTSWVKGVLYTAEMMHSDGILPYAVESKLIDKFVENPVQFNFFAHSFSSTAVNVSGVTAVRRCLHTARFKIIPGWIVPNNISEDTINSWLGSDLYTFNPIVADYVIYNGASVSYRNAGMYQFNVSKLSKYVDAFGYLKCSLHEQGGTVRTVEYADVVKYNIHSGSLVLLNSDKEITYCKNPSTQKKTYKDSITCSYCGRVYKIPESGPVSCVDVHCPSKLPMQVEHFMKVLKLPYTDLEDIVTWVKSKKITSVPDVLVMDEYKDMKIDVTVPTILRSLIPATYIANPEIFKLFAISCASNKNTMVHYIYNPGNIEVDLHLNHRDLEKFVLWLSDGYNASDLITLLSSDQLNVECISRKYEAAPILRSKHVFLTGSFIRGSLADISEILQSYSATVSLNFSDSVNCVIVGGLQEDIDGKSINIARNMGIPIFTEDRFFINYDIDGDLRQCNA